MRRAKEGQSIARPRTLGLGALIGGAAAYFFDPEIGRRRRAVIRDRTRAAVRRGARRAERAGRGAGARVYGISQQLQHRRAEPKDFDDVTLARKVESEL